MNNSSYLSYLNSHKLTGYIFKTVPLPSGHPALFPLFIILIFSFLYCYFPSYPIIILIGSLICLEHYCIVRLRNEIIEECEIEEAILQSDFITTGMDQEYPEDPLYITESDRKGIFREVIYKKRKYGFLYKIKNHYGFLGLIVILHFVVSMMW